MNKNYQIKNNCKKYQFEKSENGQQNFCNTCLKTVTDLSSIKSSELLEEVKKYENNCVSIKRDQLSYVNKIINQKSKVAALALAATMAGSSCNRNIIQGQSVEEGRVVINETKNDSQKGNVISGVLFEQETNEPLIGGSIYILDSKLGVATGIDGEFTLTIPDEFIDDGKIEIQYIGYKKIQIEINEVVGKDIRIYLGQDDQIIIGYIEMIE